MSNASQPRVGVASRGLARLDGLAEFLDAEIVASRFAMPSDVEAIAGWGRRPRSERARKIARARGIPFLCLEDGFLRSLGLGKETPPLSIVVDDVGIYYDATTASRLEHLIAGAHDRGELARAERAIALWRDGRLSKYNHARDAVPAAAVPYALVVDQTAGDASIAHGLADATRFAQMLEAALDEHPRLPIVLKLHPDVVAGYKRGHFAALTCGAASRVTVVASDAHPGSLLERAETVYAVTSQMGFEALIWGKPVCTFGMPFYAGWGLTRDALPAPARRRTSRAPSLADLVHAALIGYPRYRDPESGKRCEFEVVARWLALQRRMRARFPETVHAVAFSRWKKPIVRAFFSGSRVEFVAAERDAPAHATLAVWGRRAVDVTRNRDVVRLEDGFLRSVGLGAGLVKPVSWVMDRCGIYYDPAEPSDLEHLLATHPFDDALRARAQTMRERIVERRITKYNVGAAPWRRPASGKRVILVPGQVESDASIAFGTRGIRRNVDLLAAVRAEHPDDHVLYKPHPDVVARLRATSASEAEASRWCDEIVTDGAMGDLLMTVDAVATMTSLTGFEALLRGVRVVTYGRPFYTGWGLTDDRCPPPRRGRALALDELVAGALILYPTYVSRTTSHFMTPERALDELTDWRAAPIAAESWRRSLRQALIAPWSRRRTA